MSPHVNHLSQSSATEGSPDLAIPINGSNFTTQSTVLIDGLQPLVITVVSPNKLTVLPGDMHVVVLSTSVYIEEDSDKAGQVASYRVEPSTSDASA